MDPASQASRRVQTPTARPEPRISVVLGASPRRPDFHEPAGMLDDHAVPPVISDLSPQFRTQTGGVKQTPVPMPQLPGMTQPRQQEVGKRTPAPLPQRPAVAPALGHSASGTSTPTGRGRPKGWKPGMSYAMMRGNKPPSDKPSTRPKAGQVGVVKRRGRPPRQPSPPPRDLYHRLDPPFLAFLCEWEGCKAELHNLETLRRHVNVIHVQEQEDGRCCMWGKCGRREPVLGFGGAEELEAHVEGEHLEPFAWHVGDGPANSSGRGVGREGSEDGIPGYLKDADGNQVTPSIRGQQVEDYVTWRDNRRKLKELLLERDRNLPSEGEDGSDESV